MLTELPKCEWLFDGARCGLCGPCKFLARNAIGAVWAVLKHHPGLGVPFIPGPEDVCKHHPGCGQDCPENCDCCTRRLEDALVDVRAKCDVVRGPCACGAFHGTLLDLEPPAQESPPSGITVKCGWCGVSGPYDSGVLPVSWRWVPWQTYPNLRPACWECQRVNNLG